jgi:putative FmdB family regulatory protein
MPTYQFRCPDGSIIERVFKISEVPERIPCPDGVSEAVRMISGGAGLIFKGSGFYITDYGKDGKKDQRDAAGKAEARKEAASTESKSASSTPKSGSEGGAKSDSSSSAKDSSSTKDSSSSGSSGDSSSS